MGFTGIDDPYEAPAKPEVTIDATGTTPQDAAAQLIEYLEKRGILK
jgi:adenylylsulfate kinase-like enzyme